MIQPRITPKHIPAMTYAIESAFIRAVGSWSWALGFGLSALGFRFMHRAKTQSRKHRARSPNEGAQSPILVHRQDFQVIADALFEADEQRVADEGMADRYLIEIR